VILPVPHSEAHPVTRLTIETPRGVRTASFDESHKECQIALPDGVLPEEEGVYAEFCGQDGRPDPRMKPVVIQEPTAAPIQEPSTDPQPALLAEGPQPEWVLEWKTEQ